MTQVEFNNWDVVYTDVEEEKEDIVAIAKQVRRMISLVPGATFGVRINRQWAKIKDRPHSVIYVSGGIKFWADDYSDKKQERSNLMLQGIIKDIAEEYQLEVTEGLYGSSYMLIQYH